MVATSDGLLDLLVKGEQVLGVYHVRLAKFAEHTWSGAGPRLEALVTNYRLLLVPQTFRPYPPASIPRHYVDQVWNMSLGRRSGVLVSLKPGYRLYMFVSWGQCSHFVFDLKAMLQPPPPELRHFTPALITRDLRRLIQYIECI